MIGGTFIHRLGLGHRWSVFLSFSSLFLRCFFVVSFHLATFVWVGYIVLFGSKKKVLLQIGVFNTQTIVEFFLGGLLLFLRSLGLEDSKV